MEDILIKDPTHEFAVDRTELFECYEIVNRLKELVKNTSSNPEHCCQAFEYLREELQQILEGITEEDIQKEIQDYRKEKREEKK